jgi:RimJ/RimL family protein N-acetyltransferase
MDTITGDDVAVAAWVSARIGAPLLPPYTAIGFRVNGSTVAGAVFNDYTAAGNVEVTVAADRPFTRGMIRAVSHYVFVQLGCARMSIHTRTGDTKTRNMARRAGFVQECVRMHYYGENKHAALYRMLRKECRWLTGDAK